ncbi:MAG TPA: complex I NDUFA9 subunit family protein [Ramlibacter sp.]|nr:complex I NDUFA9 subunit family protein [Ramlibacter sp.]
MKRILVLGGTGFVGGHLCKELARLQYRVTVPTRSKAQAVLSQPLVDLVQADIHDKAALARLIAGHDAVVNLVAILHGDLFRFEYVHVELVKKIARACQDSGVLRLVHVSALGAATDAPSMYQRSKAAGEAVLQGSQLDWTVLRPSVIFGEGDQFLALFARLQKALPIMPLAGADTLFQPVWVGDVVAAVVQCLQRDDTVKRTFEVCGPERFTLRQLVKMAGSLSGHARPVIGLPPPIARLQALFMELAPGPTLMSRDNLDSMKVSNVASGKLPGLDALGIAPHALDAIAPTYLGARQSSPL